MLGPIGVYAGTSSVLCFPDRMVKIAELGILDVSRTRILYEPLQERDSLSPNRRQEEKFNWLGSMCAGSNVADRGIGFSLSLCYV